MVKSFRILVPFPLVQQIGKTVVNARQRIRMLLAPALFPTTPALVDVSAPPLRAGSRTARSRPWS